MDHESSRYRLLENLPDAFVYCQIITDDKGKPVDYIFLDVNPAFEQTTGLKAEEVVGKYVTEIYPGIENDGFDWIGFFGQVALTGKSASFEQYFEPADTWYNIFAYSDSPGYFAVLFRDITQRKQAEEQYRLLAENASDIIWTADLELNYTYVSPSAERILGYSAEELVLFSVDKTLTPSSRERASRVLQEELAKEGLEEIDPERTRSLELEHICKDGSTVKAEAKMSFLREQDETPCGIFGITRDISDRKKAEEALAASEERYRLLVENIGDLIFSVTDQGLFTYISPNIEAILGYKATDLIGRSFIEFVHPDDVSNISLSLHEVMNRFRETAGKYTKQVAVEYRARHKNGQWRWLSARNTILKAVNNGHEMVAVARDITEQKASEAALQESEEKYRTIVENTNDALFVHDFNGVILDVNKNACLMLGYSREALLGASLSMIDSPQYVKLMPERRKQVIAEGMLVFESEAVRKDGSLVPVEVSAKLVSSEGSGLIQSFVRDITERKEAEQKLADYTEELEQLYRYLSQEISNAQQVHEQILPQSLPAIESISFAAYYQPAEKMGGDFYDLINRENKLIFYLSDVSGHGLDGAMLSFFVKNTISSYIDLAAVETIEPKAVLNYLSEKFYRENVPEELFIAIFLAVLDLDTMDLTYCGAGFQVPPIVRLGEGEQLELVSKGTVISRIFCLDALNFEEDSVKLSPGSTIFFTTDGLTEQGSSGGYYMDRLPDLFYANAHLPPELIKQVVVEDFRSFNGGSQQGDDDITFLVLQVDPPEKEVYRFELASDFAELSRLRKEVMIFDYDTDRLEEFLIGLHELVNNAIEHGNRLDPGKSVIVEIVIVEEYILAAVEDEGEGFNWRERVDRPLELSGDRERGLGIIMTRLSADRLVYNDRGNRVILVKE